MKIRSIPKTNLKVSVVCLGTMTFGSPLTEPEAVKLVHYACDQGINFIDTANMYEGYARVPGSAGGVAEAIVGKAMADRHNDFIVATKLGMKVGNAPEDEGTSPTAIRKHLDLSLQRLGVACIDLYYLHKPDPASPLAETLAALAQVIKAGKIRHYGVSNYSGAQLADLLKVADANGLPRPVIVQPGLSLLKQDACADLLPLCAKENIAVTPYQVLQSGLLTGKYKRGGPVPADSRKAEKAGWVWELNDDLFTKLEGIETEAAKCNLTMTQYAYRWASNQPAVVSVIAGVKNQQQLGAAISALG